MKKLFLISLIIIAGIFTIIYIWLLSIPYPHTVMSHNVISSKERGAFLSSYRVEKYDKNLIDSLKKYELNFKTDTIHFWLERVYELRPRLFYNAVKFRENDIALGYVNPTGDLDLTSDNPYFGLVDGNGGTNIALFQKYSNFLVDKQLTKYHLKAYLYFGGTTKNPLYIGNIELIRCQAGASL